MSHSPKDEEHQKPAGGSCPMTGNNAGKAPQIPVDSPLRNDNMAPMTTNVGQPISDDQNSLKAGPRGPVLLEDYVLREKLQHFDHERIPERIVHARGAAAHGHFQLYESLEDLTMAKVLTDTTTPTPVFARFSTVAGFRGSADTARDVRGFAVKMYTTEGNWDLVGNNIPVFFIQDAIKFPDLIHAVKPEPDREIPQAASAHDTFYDFISLTPESMHTLIWALSDRGLPRSISMMEGFGVHTFRLVNAKGKSTFVKFHWKPLLGVHSLVWDEAQQIAGKDPDFHRRDMWDRIKSGSPFEWELGIQTIADEDEEKYDFDVLDATKLWPEELLPVRIVGKMTLDRNPDNYFAETEQVAFNTTNIVPGIDFSNDPLLQGRNFSYLDTQLSRLGSPNFTELPINRPQCPVSNNQRDAQMRYTIATGRVSYAPASLDGHSPDEVTPASGGFVSYPAPVNGNKVRERAESFGDHYGQAKLFWNSMSGTEKEHIVKAFQFELSMVETKAVRQRMVGHLTRINDMLGAQVAAALGESDAKARGTADSVSGAKMLTDAVSKTTASGGIQHSKALSMEEQPTSPKGRKVAILVNAEIDAAQVHHVMEALKKAGATAELVGPHLGMLKSKAGDMEITKTFANTSPALYDAVFVPGGAGVTTMLKKGDPHVFLAQTYKHGKPIGVLVEAAQLLMDALPANLTAEELKDNGITIGKENHHEAIDQFVNSVGKRFWKRSHLEEVAA